MSQISRGVPIFVGLGLLLSLAPPVGAFPTRRTSKTPPIRRWPLPRSSGKVGWPLQLLRDLEANLIQHGGLWPRASRSTSLRRVFSLVSARRLLPRVLHWHFSFISLYASVWILDFVLRFLDEDYLKSLVSVLMTG